MSVKKKIEEEKKKDLIIRSQNNFLQYTHTLTRSQHLHQNHHQLPKQPLVSSIYALPTKKEVSAKKRVKWTEEEDDIIRGNINFLHNSPYQQLTKLLPGRSNDAIAARAQVIFGVLPKIKGVSVERQPFTEDDKKLIRENYNTESIRPYRDLLDIFPGRSRGSIRKQCITLKYPPPSATGKRKLPDRKPEKDPGKKKINAPVETTRITPLEADPKKKK